MTLLFLCFVIYSMVPPFISADSQQQIINLLNEDIEIISPHRSPVLVQGQDGELDALQFDGYSTWVKNYLIFPPLNSQNFTFSVTFAIPTFPSETGIIFSVNVFEIQLSQYGKISVLFRTIQGDSDYVKVEVEEKTVPIHEWINLQLEFNADDELEIFINDDLVKSVQIFKDQIQWPSSDVETEYYVGRHPDYQNELFDMNAFNGIISEMTLALNNIGEEEQDLQERNYFLFASIQKDNSSETTSPNFDLPYNDPYDIHRPRLHPMPQRSWTNEPHAFVYHKGVYHLFFQKNGNGPYWYMINWGHLSSNDLVHWTEHPVILQPQIGPDSKGIWSGHLVIADQHPFLDVPTIFYTGVDGVKAGIFVATGSSDMMSWSKFGENEFGAQPVISGRPKNEFPGDDFRDPFLFKFNQTWHMIIGTGVDTDVGRMGSLFLYTSHDLYTFNWTFQGTMFTGNVSSMKFEVGQFWEMPLFLQINSKDWLLVVNKTPNQNDVARTLYWTGSYDGSKFTPYNTIPTELEVFVNQLSPTVAYDEEERLTAIGIAPDTWNAFYNDAIYHARVGWANVFTFPKVWNITEDGYIARTPHPALKILRKQQLISEANPKDLFLVEGELQLEIISSFSCDDISNSTVGFILFKSSTEQTKIYYDFEEKNMVVDRSMSSTDQNAVRRIDQQIYHPTHENKIKFHIFIDHSMIEVFIDDKDAFVARAFPENKESTQMELLVLGNCSVAQVEVWKLDL